VSLPVPRCGVKPTAPTRRRPISAERSGAAGPR